MTIHPIATELLTAFENSLSLNGRRLSNGGALYAGVDLGTAYIVTAVVDAMGVPLAGAVTRSESSIRDGLVLDYMGAIRLLREQVTFCVRPASHQEGGGSLSAGTVGRNAQAVANVLYAADLESPPVDEPSAAAKVLSISDGAVVDIGGGTTGISVIRDGEPIYTADEATGGTHVDLVLAGHFKVDVQEAEKIKTDPTRQREILPLVTPVFQKMASIIKEHLKGQLVDTLYLVGGTSCFPGIECVIEQETDIPVAKPSNPFLVTPLGIALACAEKA